MKHLLRHPSLIKLRHWEYWNSKVVYAPLYPYWLWLSIKARSLYFLTAANPLIKNGGFIMESKRDVYDLLPKEYYPTTLLFAAQTPIERVLEQIDQAGISYPLIAKPDIGERGLGVKKIDNIGALADYAANIPVPYLIQDFVHYEKEAGIFYCKPPGAKKGFISGIVYKEPVTVTGDGVLTLTELVWRNDRYLLQWQQIKAAFPDMLDTVLPEGKEMVLVPYGNHCRGSKFTDETFRATGNLSEIFERICSRIPEFYYGRMDVRFESWEALEQGRRFSIIELNGSGSEPTHIYDPKHSLFFAWKEIARHWKILYAISKANNRKGVPYTSLANSRQDVRSFKAIQALLEKRAW